jgi:ATP-dependent Clp protease protease subunit
MARKDITGRILNFIHQYSINPETREIYLNGYLEDANKESSEIDYRVSSLFLKNLQYLVSQSEEKPIFIHLSTIGGDWGAGITIYDAISLCPCHVTAIVHGEAYSIGSLILQAADVRLVMPSSYCMIHEGSIEVPSSTQKVASSTITWSKNLTTLMLNIYAEKCSSGKYFVDGGKSEKEVRKYLQGKIDRQEDWFLSAEDAVFYGFADDIVGKNNMYQNLSTILKYGV